MMNALAGKRFFRQLRDDYTGATAIEYGLIAALIAVAVLLSTGSLGETMVLMFDNLLGAAETGKEAASSE
ncbi:Flp family type IVb pilin [Gimibacter soli]|uniref:Flp family type IVb pilin n=1 Tax=Gimibacter soli TaxID=3024400 RepID=A0AAE9XPT7_9PROT|nr:Flp family type IVb pilin [Gimibacter soli]WCL54161.1 Flp family type IVb pilin [Gimibacter soli]